MCATKEVQSKQTLIRPCLLWRCSRCFLRWRPADGWFCGARPCRLLHISKQVHLLLRPLPRWLRQTPSCSNTSIPQACRPLDSLLLDHIQRHIIVCTPIIQRTRIRHRPIHHPPPAVILRPYEILDLGLIRHVSHGQFMLPVLIRPRISPPYHGGHLLVGPAVQIHRLHPRDVHSHAAVDT